MYANIRLWWQSFEKHKKEPNHLHSTLEILVNKYQKKQGDGFKIPSDHEPAGTFVWAKLKSPTKLKGTATSLVSRPPSTQRDGSTWHNAFEFVGTNYLRSLSFACLKQVIRLWQFESKGLRASGQFRAYLKDRMHNLFSQAPSLSCEHNPPPRLKSKNVSNELKVSYYV